MVLFALLSPFIAAGLTVSTGSRIVNTTAHVKLGQWLVRIPLIVFFGHAALFYYGFLAADLAAQREWTLSMPNWFEPVAFWGYNLANLFAFLTIEWLLLRAFSLSLFRKRAALSALMCLVTYVFVFTVPFRS